MKIALFFPRGTLKHFNKIREERINYKNRRVIFLLSNLKTQIVIRVIARQ